MGCAPQAPADLEVLCSYLFQNQQNQAEAISGVNALKQWAEDYPSWEDGYRIDNLTTEHIEDSTAPQIDLSDQLGVATLNLMNHSVSDLAWAFGGVLPSEAAPETFYFAEQSFNEGADCFWDKECLFLSKESNLGVQFPLNVRLEGNIHSELQWLELDSGWALLQRDWLIQKPEMNVPWITIHGQYSLSALIPFGEQTLRLDSLWAVITLGDTAVPKDVGIQLLVGKSEKTLEEIDLYLSSP
ncbi:MAG: hypothetical protein CMK59_15450 [Proteobacteria bacterium]|nr:hypothetical protein [Pseudomonadota bacterium]